MARPTILDAWGRPINRANLTQEAAAARVGTARSPAPGYPGQGLTPVRLTQILRAADLGHPRQYLELAEEMEERDPHYAGVMATRKRSVAQLDITVEAGSEKPEDEKIAQMVREYIERDELAGEIFNILDCIGKGYSGTEVLYETSEGQYRPRLIPRDPRIFRFDANDRETPMVLNDAGQAEPLEPGHWIWATIKAKSGLSVRSGLARIAAWGWMFKMYTQRDWQIFQQNYGQPVRVGYYGAGATEDDKNTLFTAVSNIAGDCAAIIPESMKIEFVETSNVGASSGLYKERADWIDQQVSKAVLGQTATTDAVIGGLGSGKEHRQVQEDIEKADVKALAAILNRDLIRVWVQMEYGPQKVYPRLRIGRAEQQDLKVLTDALAPMIDRGLEVDASEIRNRFGLAEPKPGAKLLRAQGQAAPATEGGDPASPIKRFSGEIKRGEPLPGMVAAPQAEGPLAGLPQPPAPEDLLTDRMVIEAQPTMDAILQKLSQMTEAATTFDELHQMLVDGFPDIDVTGLADLLAAGFTAANLGGRVTVAEEAT